MSANYQADKDTLGKQSFEQLTDSLNTIVDLDLRQKIQGKLGVLELNLGAKDRHTRSKAKRALLGLTSCVHLAIEILNYNITPVAQKAFIGYGKIFDQQSVKAELYGHYGLEGRVIEGIEFPQQSINAHSTLHTDLLACFDNEPTVDELNKLKKRQDKLNNKTQGYCNLMRVRHLATTTEEKTRLEMLQAMLIKSFASPDSSKYLLEKVGAFSKSLYENRKNKTSEIKEQVTQLKSLDIPWLRDQVTFLLDTQGVNTEDEESIFSFMRKGQELLTIGNKIKLIEAAIANGQPSELKPQLTKIKKSSGNKWKELDELYKKVTDKAPESKKSDDAIEIEQKFGLLKATYMQKGHKSQHQLKAIRHFEKQWQVAETKDERARIIRGLAEQARQNHNKHGTLGKFFKCLGFFAPTKSRLARMSDKLACELEKTPTCP